MMNIHKVTLEKATLATAPLLSNLLEQYQQELSGLFGLSPGPDGRFEYARLPRYWSEPDSHFAWLIRVDSELAGFALVTRGSPASENPEDLDIAEFFIHADFRRNGIGRCAALLLWNQLPGHWLVRVSEKNSAAMPFWEGAIQAFTLGHFSKHMLMGKTHAFHVFSFSSPAE